MRTPRAQPPAERLGLLGGTFDPPHVGHVAAASAVRAALDLDRVLLVVANDPWQKAPHRRVTPTEDRLALVRAAVEGVPGVEASTLEIDRGGPSYTVETVEALLAAAAAAGRPAPEVFVVVGADLVGTLDSWERVADLRRSATLAVVTRPRSPALVVPTGWRAAVVPGPGLDVSSSRVRALLARGDDVTGVLADPVIRCIQRRDLYAGGR